MQAEVQSRALATYESAQTRESKKHKDKSIQREETTLQISGADNVIAGKHSHDNSNELSDNVLIRLVSIISVKDTKTIAVKYFGVTKVFIEDAEYQHRDVTQFKFEILTHWRNTHRLSRQVEYHTPYRNSTHF